MQAKHGTKKIIRIPFLDKTSPRTIITLTWHKKWIQQLLSRHANRMPNQFHHQHFHADHFSNLQIHERHQARHSTLQSHEHRTRLPWLWIDTAHLSVHFPRCMHRSPCKSHYIILITWKIRHVSSGWKKSITTERGRKINRRRSVNVARGGCVPFHEYRSSATYNARPHHCLRRQNTARRPMETI